MKAALLGFEESGRSTLFQLLTGRRIPEGRQETETLEGMALVRDPRVDKIAEICQPQKIKFAETSYALCPAVTKGEGKRDWLEPARRADLLCMVVRAFASDSVYHPLGSVNPERDRSELRMEVLLADLEMIENRLTRMEKEKRAGQTPAQMIEEKTLQKCRDAIESDKLPVHGLEPQELASVRSLGLMCLKPFLWVYNVNEADVHEDGLDPVTIACLIEKEIMEIQDPAERQAYLEDMGLKSSGIDRMSRAVYDTLGLMSFYTMGKDEVRAWTVAKGATAPEAAGKIHTDMQRGFIRAEVIKFDDLVEAGSEAEVKNRGKLVLKGKDYVMQDGDICSFLFNV